jgi:hypothetical protein
MFTVTIIKFTVLSKTTVYVQLKFSNQEGMH